MYLQKHRQEMIGLEDAQLIEKIQNRVRGSHLYVQELLLRHHDALVRRCYFFLKNQADAEDAAQETELRVFRAIYHFKGESAYRTWLYAIADNQCRTIADKRSKRVMSDHLIALIEMSLNAEQQSNVLQAEHTEVKNMTNCALESISPQGREIINLRFYQDKGLDEISAILDLGLSATKMRLYRSIKQFADSLPEEAQTVYASM